MPRARERLNVLGRNWRVHFLKHSPIDPDDGKPATGLTIFEKHLIQIHVSGVKERQQSTLLHEVLHAVLDMTVSDHPANEEKCVTALESGLFQVLRHPDNRWLVEYILEP